MVLLILVNLVTVAEATGYIGPAGLIENEAASATSFVVCKKYRF